MTFTAAKDRCPNGGGKSDPRPVFSRRERSWVAVARWRHTNVAGNLLAQLGESWEGRPDAGS